MRSMARAQRRKRWGRSNMPNTFDQFDGTEATKAAAANPFDAFDEKSAANPFDQFHEPASSAVVDVAKRVARGAVAGTGQIYSAMGAAADSIDRMLPGWMRRPAGEEGAFTTSGQALKTAAAEIPVDAARDAELKSVLAEGAGAAVPAVAAAIASPVLGVATLAGQTGEAEREAALAAGDSPELAAEKAKIGRLGGAVMGVIPAGPVRAAAGAVERVATRGATGAVINAAQDAALQQAENQKVDWGRVKLAGATGAGMGLVLGAGEAIALKRALGTQASHEGKTLGQAVDEIATETGSTPADVQARINAAVGLDAGPAKSAQESAAVLASENPPVVKSARDSAEVFQSPVSGREASFLEQTAARNALPPAASPESIAWLHESDAGRQAEAGLTSLDSRLGAGQGATRERARLQEQLPVDSPLREESSAPAGEPGPQLSSQAQRMYDEHGRIDPSVLLPLARAAVGGSIGYATGDTPEERVRNALIGAGAGAAASPALVARLTRTVFASPASSAAQQAFRAKFQALKLKVAPQSLLPTEIRTQLRWGDQASNAVTTQGLALTRDLERAILASGAAPARAAAAQVAKDFLDGKLPASAVPAPVRVQAQKVRDFVDELSDRAVAEGVVSGQLANTFLSNKGSYLRRSYEIFLNPDYKPAPAAVPAAIAAVAKANGVNRAEAEGIVAGIIDRNSRGALSDFLLGRGKVAGKDVSSLVKRQDLLPEIRELLGEVKDPILAANQTIPRMARLLEQDAAQKQVRAIGVRLGLFSDTQSLAHPTPLVAESSATHDVLAGLYTQPEIAAAMQREAGSGRTAFVPEVLWKGLTTATAFAKMAKTVGNPESYAPNVIGGIISNIGNANFRYNHAARGLALGAEELGALRQFLPTAPSRNALRAELTELQKLGVIGESVNAGDLLRTIDNSFFGRLADKTKSVVTIPSKVYGMTDDFNRYIAWQSERARYAKAFPGMAADELKRHAAEVVRATTPVYSNVPKVLKQLSVAGLAPSFVNFTYEVFRNTKNSFAIGMRDLQQGKATGSAALMRAGAERLAAITALVGASSMYGVSKLSRDSNRITDEKDAAVRYFSPPWNKDGMLQYHTPAEKGEPVQVSNLSYLVPHALLFQALEAGRRGAPEGQAIPEFLSALNEQFGLGNSVLIPAVAGAVTGNDPKTGRPIPSTAVEPTMGDRAKYLAEQAFKPLVVDWSDKFNKARTGERGDYGRVYSEKEQIERLLGLRAQTIDPQQAMAWKAQRLGEGFQHAADIYRLQQKREAPPERLQTFYQLADEARRGQFEEMGRMLEHARALGVDDEKTIAALRGAHLPPDAILGVLDGRYTPLEKDKAKTAGDFLADLQARPAAQRGAALAQIYRDDPAMAKAVIERAGSEAKLPGQRDKLIAGLGVADGERARYVRQKLQDLGDVDARRAFMIDLRKKGLLTDRVLEQMTKP